MEFIRNLEGDKPILTSKSLVVDLLLFLVSKSFNKTQRFLLDLFGL